ncbi:Hypothetical predicted protein [Paramuricea clavata]|uniref:Uncharacterized protein n=1 Tax=Paramuricea clavata TaxID=317549 RepID=A0A6S7IYK0_PARCT|nr:Hypothetical predicted protein [Paramuricea clavata]
MSGNRSPIDCNRLHFFGESSVVVTSGNRSRGHSGIGAPAIEVQRYASNATYTVNLLHNIHGVSHFNILRGPSNGLELLNFFEEALEQEDVFANPVIKEHDVIIMDNCDFTRETCSVVLSTTLPGIHVSEACFNHIKTTLRRYSRYTEKYTELCISDAIGMINEGLSRQFFKFCGYI